VMRVLVSRLGTGFIVLSFVGLALLAAGRAPTCRTQPRPASMAAAQPAEIRVDATAVQAPETASAVPAEPTAEPSVPLIQTVLDEDFADNRMGWPDTLREPPGLPRVRITSPRTSRRVSWQSERHSACRSVTWSSPPDSES